jgi:AraC-like DNA-binding protein
VSKQDSDLAILSFQLGGEINVCDNNYKPYRLFIDEVHSTFFTNKRELIFQVPPVFENFRIYLSPSKFIDLLAKYHGRFSDYADKVNRSEYFNMFSSDLPITPQMKTIIREILSHKIHDTILSMVYYETKICELFGCQLEQAASATQSIVNSSVDKAKWKEAKLILEQNYMYPPSLSQLAKLIGTNENKLKSGFKQQFGHSVYNNLLHYRMAQAVKLMHNDKISLEEIAHQLGYVDSAHFSRAFKKVYDMPPGKSRELQYST